MTDARRCPACRAPWRGAVTCPRCGADLAPLMRLAARAWALRESARAALLAGEGPSALAPARAALALEHTEGARRLLVLALLATGEVAAARAHLASAVATPPG